MKNLPIYDPLKPKTELSARDLFSQHRNESEQEKERERRRKRASRVPYNICVEFICRRYGFNVHPLCIKIHEIPQQQNEPNALFTPGETPFGRGRWGAECWQGAQFHGPFGLAALGVNNNHKDVTITH